MKKLLCVVCLLASVLFFNTANACFNNRCGGMRAPVMHARHVPHRHAYVPPRRHAYVPPRRHASCAPAKRPPVRRAPARSCSKRSYCG